MNTGLALIVTDGLGARVFQVLKVIILRLTPPRKADHIGIIVTNVTMRLLHNYVQKTEKVIRVKWYLNFQCVT